MVPLTHLHTFSLPSYCEALHEITAESNLTEIIPKQSSWLMLGEGSNSVFVDDYAGTVLLNRIKGIDVTEEEEGTTVKVGAGENWHQFVRTCLKHAWYGVENLALIPGTVGAAPIQNIGAYGVEVAQFIRSVHFYDVDSRHHTILAAQDCEFGYRESIFKRDLAGRCIITHVTFYFPHDWQPTCSYAGLDTLAAVTPQAIFDRVVEIRQSKLPDPAVLGNAGSFFKNPLVRLEQFEKLKQAHGDVPSYPQSATHVKMPAAWLIDKAGFKGQEFEGIRCHPSQPLVLTNTGHASGGALITMAQQIMEGVSTQFGVVLEPEVRLIGKTGLVTL